MKNKLFLFVTFGMCMLCAIAGCGIFYFQDLPRNYQLNKANQRGVAIFSVQCDAQYSYSTAQLMYRDIGDKFWVLESYLPVNIACDGSRQIKALDLPGGAYHFNGLTYYFEKKALNFPEIIFKVVPGKATYIGNFKLNLGDKNIHLLISNEDKIDIPLIKDRFINISSGDYLVDIMKYAN